MVNMSEAGRCVFRMYMPHAGNVTLLGSFCNWELDESGSDLELTRDEEGWWSTRLNLPAGDHEFCYLVDGRTWMPDYAAAGMRRDSNGRWVSLINVPARRDTSDRPIGTLAEPRISRLPEREPGRALAHAS